MAEDSITLNLRVGLWVPVSDRLPPCREKVLVAYSRGVTIAELDGYLKDPKHREIYWRGHKGPKHSLSSVTHWMSLPEPPMEASDV